MTGFTFFPSIPAEIGTVIKANADNVLFFADRQEEEERRRVDCTTWPVYMSGWRRQGFAGLILSSRL